MSRLSSSPPISAERAEQILRAHNVERAKHGLAPLEWDWSLAQTAQRWASQCRWMHWQQSESALGSAAFRATQPPLVNGRWSLGENLAMTAGQPKSARASVSAGGWIDERKDWTCGATVQAANECAPGKMCGHLTQMLWADTKRVGCAIQECPNGFPELARSQNAEYLVCEYSPPGNFVGQAPFSATQCAIKPIDNPASIRAVIPPFSASATTAAPAPQTTIGAPVPVLPNIQPGALNNNTLIPRPVGSVPLLPNNNTSSPVTNKKNSPDDENDVTLVTAPDGTEILVPSALQSRVQQLTPEQLESLAQRTRDLAPADQPFVVATFLQELEAPSSSEAEFWKSAGIALGVLVGIALLAILIWLIVRASRPKQPKSRIIETTTPPEARQIRFNDDDVY